LPWLVNMLAFLAGTTGPSLRPSKAIADYQYQGAHF